MWHSHSFEKSFLKGFLGSSPNFTVVLCVRIWSNNFQIDSRTSKSDGKMQRRFIKAFCKASEHFLYLTPADCLCLLHKVLDDQLLKLSKIIAASLGW